MAERERVDLRCLEARFGRMLTPAEEEARLEHLAKEGKVGSARDQADCITEGVRAGIKGYRKTEAKFSQGVPVQDNRGGGLFKFQNPGAYVEPQDASQPAPAPAPTGGSVSFGALGESRPAGPKYDDGQAICEGDICADGDRNLAEVKKLVAEGLIVEIPSKGLFTVPNLQGCRLMGRKA